MKETNNLINIVNLISHEMSNIFQILKKPVKIHILS